MLCPDIAYLRYKGFIIFIGVCEKKIPQLKASKLEKELTKKPDINNSWCVYAYYKLGFGFITKVGYGNIIVRG